MIWKRICGRPRQYCKNWNDNGYPDYRISVNLSVIQLLQNDIVENVEKAIKDSGVNAGNLILEVTESLAINDMEKMKGILGRTKALSETWKRMHMQSPLFEWWLNLQRPSE